MRRINRHFRSVSRFLIVLSLSYWIVLIIGLLSYWLGVLRLIKSVLKRKEKEEKAEETKTASIANTDESSVLSSAVEAEPKAAVTKTEPAQKVVATTREPEPRAAVSAVEAEPKAAVTKTEPEQKAITTTREPEPRDAASTVEVEPKAVAVEAKPEDNVLAVEAIEAYCVKCRQKRSIEGAKKVTTQKGRRAIEGTCSICSTKLFRFIARE